MSYKTTRKNIVNYSNNLRMCGYCDLASLLYNHDAVAYTLGVYGWNFDVYEVYGLTICTGYRGMPGERLKHISEYEVKANKILHTYDISYEQAKEQIENLLKEFCLKNGGSI